MTPWMDEKEIERISFYAAGKVSMLEWGSGGSTLHFSSLVGKYFSIEHDPVWAEKVREDLPENVELLLVEAEWPYLAGAPSEPGQFESYTAAISKFGESEFDIILVDGRARIDCALEAVKWLPRRGVLFIHDFWTRSVYLQRSEQLLEHYRIIDAVTSSSQSLAVFEKR